MIGQQSGVADAGALRSPDVDESVRTAIRQAVATLPDPERRVAEYHFGWLDDPDGNGSGPKTGGKALRSALALASARAVGGAARRAVPGAVAVELVHDFSLLHDDVIDGDRTRRHRPAAWVRFGVGAAVLTGDALWALALQVITKTGDAAAVNAVIETLADLMRGQSQDVAFESRNDVTVQEYRSMAEDKTGALLGGACEVGARLGGSSSFRAAQLRLFGRHLGVAFQCADDVLGIWGRAELTGKPVGGDVIARKKTLPVIAALADPGDAGRRLSALYRRAEPPDPEECALIAGLIEEAGGRAAVEAEMERQVGLALACLDAAEPEPAAREDLARIVSWAALRDR
ncbi:family 2 encapsulin nanocompartment cargo protein polyprenyl transferase [Streptosporangium fragile]|uniref:Family 2 encapsulin nanocompartment cargo protein polyprenyl transferase n=1 Tax=Streptosporangium fragile TaxID=46186 RepID=A0ABP6IRT6_9ACTN